ncbi:MAG: hypothetical protein WCT33_02775 [Patescibacteria group bacterium]|jgi:hypothetical protein
MTTTIISILAVILLIIAVFLGKEMLKKFGFMKNFVQNSNQIVVWKYTGDRKPGMYNIVLHGKTSFCALVGIDFNIPLIKYSGFDHYAFLRSGENHTAVISTYLGKGAREFQFLVNTDTTVNPVTVTSSEEDQSLRPDSESKPHWYQRMGF